MNLLFYFGHPYPWPSQNKNLNSFPHLITTVFIKLLVCTRTILGYGEGVTKALNKMDNLMEFSFCLERA